MVEQTVVGNIFSGSVDAVVWGGGFLVAVSCLLFALGSKIANASERSILRVSFFGVLLGFAVWGFLALLGIVGLASLGLASVLLFVFCLVSSLDLFEVGWSSFFVRVLFGGVLFVLFFEVAALEFYNVPLVFNSGFASSGVALHWNLVELCFSNLAYPFLPYVYFLLILLGLGGFVALGLPWKKMANAVGGQGWAKFWERLSGLFVLQSEGEFLFLGRRVVVLLAVLVGAFVSCLFVLFTVLPWANPTGMLVGVDAPVYYQWIAQMKSLDANSALGFAFANDRALFLVLAFGLSFVVSPVWVVQFASAFLLVAFGVVCFFTLRLLCRLREVWVFGVLFVPLGFQGLGLIYSGFYANMLALILVLVYVLLFFRLLDRWSGFGFVLLLFVSVGVLFSHSWTWFIFVVSLLLLLFLEWCVNRREGFSGRLKLMGVFVLATLGVGFSCDLLRRVLSPVSASSSVLSTATSSLGVPNLGYFFSGLEKSVDFVLGGVFANGLLVFLGLVGLLVLFRLRSGLSRFFVSWIFVGCVSVLFAADDIVFDRALFMLPWVVLCSLGLFWGLGVVGRVGCFGRWRFWVLAVVLFFMFLSLLNFALRYVFNINIF